MKKITLFLLLNTLLISSATASTALRWTTHDGLKSDFTALVNKINVSTGNTLSTSDFLLIEDRPLSGTGFKTYIQIINQIPVFGASLRIWENLATHDVVQLEANLEIKSALQKQILANEKRGASFESLFENSDPSELLNAVKKEVAKNSEDSSFGEFNFHDVFSIKQGLVRIYKVRGRRGNHNVTVSLETAKVISSIYKPFSTGDLSNGSDEFSISADLFPIYEQTEKDKLIQKRVRSELKYIKNLRPNVGAEDPYVNFRKQHYLDSTMDPIRGNTEEGRAQGYWSMDWIKAEALRIKEALPVIANTFSADKASAVFLEGRYATISFHPMVQQAFKKLPFTLSSSPEFKPDWKETILDGKSVVEMIPFGSFQGSALFSAEEALGRPARILADHNPVEYMRDGFDELQVYFAINQLMDSLHSMGFNDPELSTRPFHAFLYDPDISMRDNAYYTDDTINFTTYSSGAQNFARDNSTIWHELGHGIMDRLMGPYIQLADTGGLSEGMADFVAALVIADVSNAQSFDGSTDFRIINRTGFSLTNEVHDDGESYGGAMKDILDAAIAKFGMDGLKKVTDLTLDTMRLTRNNPGLTANDWFNHMLYADELGKTGVRNSGELKDVITTSLAGRNFSLAGEKVAQFVVMNLASNSELTSSSPASRERPIGLKLKVEEKAAYKLDAKVVNSNVYAFQFPVEIQVHYTTGALQGAIHWTGEDKTPDHTDRYVLNTPNDVAHVVVEASGKCDSINREDGSCVDYAYIQVVEAGKTRPTAKKRFYLRVKTQ